ncbi:acetyl-CoA acetyltransferase [Neobacillus niacini]|uniref:thiolase family protein n=1 Tax=Neobacillus niacini TaxID=86668 RepID=UPI00285FEDE4|nr:thiolase family protein [Neobacillus niacini]MDR7076053.1 acetyl-CoA acetyltransferase [Neobacillus niacini]
MNLKDKAAVVGVGTTKYGVFPEHDDYSLGVWAFKEALEDSGIDKSEIDGLIVNRISNYQKMAEILGINPTFIKQLPSEGRQSGTSIQLAVMAIALGIVKTVALIYGNNGKSIGMKYGGMNSTYGSGNGSEWFPYGMTSPGAHHALMFQRHMHLYGTTSEQLAAIPIAFRKHASLNPNAVMRKKITVKDHQTSRYIVEPLHIYDYCLINDGAVCMILTSKERSRNYKKKPVIISGFGQATAFTNSSVPPEDFWYEAMNETATQVYRMAEVDRNDMDGLMIYDNFSPTVLFSLEGFGFCPIGEAGEWIQNGRLELEGEFPTNTNGGHLSESYMQGWNLNVEAVRQLRGECLERQIKDANFIQYMCASPVVTSIIYRRDY